MATSNFFATMRRELGAWTYALVFFLGLVSQSKNFLMVFVQT